MSLWHVVAVLFLLSALVVYKVIEFIQPPEIPKVDEDAWWGIGERREDDVRIKPFKIHASEEVISDLRWRLKNRRPIRPSIEGSANQYGLNSEFSEVLLDYWLNEYNWTEREPFLNKYPQFRTEIQGLHLHFIHVKPPNPENKKVLPLIMVHGWPGSVREFYEVIELMSDRKDKDFVVEMVVPSLPGFGFSDATTKPGLGLLQTAVLLKKLMNRLGHQQFYMQGGDLGAIALQILAVLYPDSVLGYHTNLPVIYTPRSYFLYLLGSIYPPWVDKPEIIKHLYPVKARAQLIYQESGYFHIQSTKPDTIGAAMDDSPVALGLYIAEKYMTGTDMTWLKKLKIKEFVERIGLDKLSDNLMYYWMTSSATTAFRMYYESFENFFGDVFNALRVPLESPVAIFRATNELIASGNFVKEVLRNMVSFTDYDSGHFVALERPARFTDDVMDSLEKFEANKAVKKN
ncbi:hypothetical protein GWI33_022718 [Rhynchophorus ferrugineus]|uniref:Epoxide hydrolase n=1 Tax=Rhynchophorus ferrugineus TaxID=354439 RepID=A0A834MHA0_RHYFE|nr:hypothetical protein GWI33_022718 [Rhynchophorus ferrugineus]